MAVISNKTALVHSADSGTTYAQITDTNSNPLCITDYPDLDVDAEPDQVEVTTLCDDAHEFIDGLKNYPEEIEFGMNYTKALYSALTSAIATDETTYAEAGGYWGVYFGDTSGTDGKFTFRATARVVVNGASSGEVRKMTLYLKPRSAISFA